MSEGVQEEAPRTAPASERKWSVWGAWFGVALLPWVVISAENNVVSVFLVTAGSLSYSYNVLLGIWNIVLYLVLVPFMGYFVQQRLKSFDLTGIFVMTLAAGLLVGIFPIPIVLVCTTRAFHTCSYQFGLNVYGQPADVVSALAGALDVSLVIVAGAFLSQWRRGALTIASPARSRNFLLAAWLVIGFLAAGARSIAWAPANAIFGNNYLLVFPLSTIQLWYTGVSLLSGPVLALFLGYFLYARLHEVGMKQLFSMVALGGMLAYVISQAAYGIALARMAYLVLGTINWGIFPAWIVLSGCLLSIFEKGRTRSGIDEAASLGHQDASGRLSYPTLAVGFAVTIVFFVLDVLSQSSVFNTSLSFRGDVGASAFYGLLIGLFIVFSGFALLYSEHQAKKAVVSDAADVP